MGIVTGILSLLCFVLLSVKALTKRLHLEKTDKWLMKVHKMFSGLLFILCLLHIALVFPVLQNRDILVTVSGLAAVTFMILLIALCHMIKDVQKKMRWHRILDIAMLLCLIGHVVFYYADYNAYRQNMANIVWEDINIAEIADGIYEGEYDAGYIYARVEVEIRDGKMISITILEHRNERGKAAERITDAILEKQEITVDAVSGATNSSNVIKKAVENALLP